MASMIHDIHEALRLTAIHLRWFLGSGAAVILIGVIAGIWREAIR